MVHFAVRAEVGAKAVLAEMLAYNRERAPK